MVPIPFVNRHDELRAFQGVWQEAHERETRLFLLSGETGVGKTRFLSEIESRARREGAQVAWGQCAETGGSAYQPWRAVLRTLIPVVEKSDPGLMTFLGPLLSTLVPELKERRYMAGLIFPAPLDPKAEQMRLNAAVAQLLRKASALTPLLVFLDDGQWADEATLALLAFLARTASLGKVLLGVAYRDDSVDAGHPLLTLAGSRVQRTRLTAFAPATTGALLQALLNAREVPAALQDKVQWTTGGNPFFVEELVRALVEGGKVLRPVGSGWQVDEVALAAVRLPASTRQVVEQRWANLPAEARAALNGASIMGPVFWVGYLDQLPADPGAWPAFLDEGVRKGLLTLPGHSTLAGEAEYRFASSTIWEVAYASTDLELRQAGHRAAANWLLRRPSAEVEEQLGLIADHWEKAGDAEMAIPALRRAGQQAMAQFAGAEAAAYFSRALRLAPAGDLTQRYELLEEREGAYDRQGARQPQAQDLAALQELARALADPARQIEVTLRRVRFGEAIGDYPAAIAAVQEALAQAQAIGDTTNEARAAALWGRILWYQGDFDAANLRSQQALALAQTRALPQIAADSLVNLGVVAAQLFRYEDAVNHFQQALTLYREVGGEYMQRATRLEGDLGIVFRQLGDYAATQTRLEAVRQMARKNRDPRLEAAVESNLALLYHLQGQDERAYQFSQQACELAQAAEDRYVEGFALTYLENVRAHREIMAEYGKGSVGYDPLYRTP